jgi:hypothetical protein
MRRRGSMKLLTVRVAHPLGRSTRRRLVTIDAVDAATASLLWAACRPAPDAQGIREAVDGGADLRRAADLALAQRVSPLLWKALTANGIADDGQRDDWALDLSRDAVRCRAQALLVLPQIGPKALAPLAAAGLTPLVFKGAALVGRYAEPGLRPMDDVDLVLPPDQLDAAVAVLEKAGWALIPVSRTTHHEVILKHADLPGLPLEVHRALSTWRERSNWLTTLDLWRWRASGTVGGEPACVLPVEEEILALAAHAAKPFHTFDRLIWAVDIAVVIGAAGTTIDWDRVVALADDAACRTALAVALTQAQRLGADSPSALRTCPARNARERALEPVLSHDWPLVDRGWSVRRRLRYALVDDWRQRLMLLAGQSIRYGPGAAPRHVVNLSARGLRRWWQLRREAPRSDGDREGNQPAGL